jgi:hypothetical protein
LNQKLVTIENGNLEEKRAKLEVECAKSVEGCSVTSEQSSRHYFRARVTLRCHQAVSGCFGSLTRIEGFASNRLIREQEVDTLPFAPSHDPDSTSKTLSPDVPIFLDVLVVDFRSGVDQVYIAHKQHGANPARTADGHYVFESVGIFSISVKMGGTGIPTQTVRFRFNWTGDYRTSELSVI